MAKSSTKKKQVAAPEQEAAQVELSVEQKRHDLNVRLYELAGDPKKAEEFEAVRLELESLGAAS